MSTIGELRNALNQMHRRACGDKSAVYMSVPADRSRDADLMLSDAIDELEALRAKECDTCLQRDIGLALLKRQNADLEETESALRIALADVLNTNQTHGQGTRLALALERAAAALKPR